MSDLKFSIAERYDFLKTYIDIVMKKEINSLIITGPTAVGKSWIVKDKTKMLDNVFYVKGFATARALFDSLYHNRNSLIIFDDCDSILENKVATNILKSALDSYDERVVSWLSKTTDKSIPLQFDFQGQIIFISNLPMAKLDKAVKSRALTIDLSMTTEEKKELLGLVMPDIRTDLHILSKRMALNALIDNARSDDQLNLRLMEQAFMFVDTTDNWYDQICFMLENNSS